MKGKDFLTLLARAMPSMSELAQYGLDEEEAEEIQASFKSVERPSSGGGVSFSSELQTLVSENDLSTVEVGLVTFPSHPEITDRGVVVAYFEADPLVVQRDGSVAMSDHARPDVLRTCAASSEAFLEALARFVEIRSRKKDWNGRLAEAASICAEAAGGSDYKWFYSALCGFLNQGNR